MSELESLRGELEGLSLDLLALLNRRAERALAVARTKQQLGLPIRDPYRESQLLDRLAAANQGPLDAATVRVLFRHVVDACVSLMEDRRRRALQNGPGAERVAVDFRGDSMVGEVPIYIAGRCSL